MKHKQLLMFLSCFEVPPPTKTKNLDCPSCFLMVFTEHMHVPYLLFLCFSQNARMFLSCVVLFHRNLGFPHVCLGFSPNTYFVVFLTEARDVLVSAQREFWELAGRRWESPMLSGCMNQGGSNRRTASEVRRFDLTYKPPLKGG